MRLSRALFTLALVVAISGLALAGAELVPGIDTEARVSSQLTVRRITPRALVFTHERPFPANSLLVEVADGSLVLCSTPYSEDATRELLDWARCHLGRRRLVAINPHFHADGVGGNPDLLAEGIPVYGSDLTARYLRERGEASRRQGLEVLRDDPADQALVRAIRLVPADHTFAAEKGLRLSFGGESVEAIYPGPAHAPDNVVVWFPSQGILFGGCMILGGPRPVNVADADLKSWPAAIGRLLELHPAIVVPGHGRHLSPALLPHTLLAVERYVAEHPVP
ncbi:MAG: MBL fold metallo-hydrolase [Candidatus Wallbacteria bacterium]|nr:MBL fold metallo-hydrolase [Candidatus Wallbacteria bacterium]